MNRLVSRVLSYAPYVALAVNGQLFFVQTPDDAFITYRYAANLISGNGPTFNPGDAVEGCSSPLHMLLSAALVWATGSTDVLFAMKLVGLLFAALTLFMMAPLGRLLGLPPRATLLAQLLVALNPNFATSATNGLETSLYGLVVVLTVYAFAAEVKAKAGWLSGALAFVALSTRPDASVLFAALLAARLIVAYRRRMAPRFVLPWLVAFVVPTAALVAARLAYYGYPLPNTFYAKDVPLWFGIETGVRYLSKALAVRTNHVFEGEGLFARCLIAVSGAVFWALLLVGCLRARRRVPLFVCLAAIAADVAFVLKSGGDWMEGWRFCVPALPFMAYLQSIAIRALAACWRSARWRASSRRARVVSCATLAFFALVAVAGPHRSWHAAHWATSGRGLLAATSDPGVSGLNQVTVAEWIAANLPHGASVAYTEIGYAGMLNPDKTFVDPFGLVTKEIAHGAPRRMKQQLGVVDPEWFKEDGPVGRALLELHPSFVLMPCPGQESVLHAYALDRTVPSTATNGNAICLYELARLTRAAPSP